MELQTIELRVDARFYGFERRSIQVLSDVLNGLLVGIPFILFVWFILS